MLDFSLKYLHLLKTKYAGLNLTRILDDQEFYEKQVLDSILPYEQCELFKKALDSRKLLVDVGFGGGFPLLPLAAHCPGIQAIGFESRGKKAEAVRGLAEELGLNNVKTYHERIHSVLINKPCVITFKAVGTIMDFLPAINASTKEFEVYFYKGPSYMEKEHPSFEKELSKEWNLVINQTLTVPGTEERRLVGFSPKNVPRGTSKELVKLTEFI